MTEKLEGYQIEGAAFLAANYRASIFDEPGLGKTAQAIRAFELVKAERAIVICPAGVRQVWPFQFKLWGRSNPRVVKADSVFDMVAWQAGRIDVLVMSYEQASGWWKDLSSDFFDCLIIDESHYLKNPDAKRTKAIVGDHGDGIGAIAGMASYVWCLTGTPIKNDPADLWVPLRLSRQTKLEFTAFQKRFFQQRIGTFSVSNTVTVGLLVVDRTQVPTGIPGYISLATRLVAAAFSGHNRKEVVALDGGKNSLVSTEIPKTVFQMLGEKPAPLCI